MKTLIITCISLTVCLLVPDRIRAQDSSKTEDNEKKHGQIFVDEDGDGYNDNAPDHDGDGIPNGLDADWLKQKKEKGKAGRFVDLDGDGIDDNLQKNGPQTNGKVKQTDSENPSLNDETKDQKGRRQQQRGKK